MDKLVHRVSLPYEERWMAGVAPIRQAGEEDRVYSIALFAHEEKKEERKGK